MSAAAVRLHQRTNLAAPVTSFVGRAADLRALGALFDTARLVSIVGPPGAGKTRLAMEYARGRVGDLCGEPDGGGVWFCDLGETTTLAGMCRAVAGVLDVGLTSDEVPADGVQRLVVAIASRGPMLLVLDDADRVARFAADTILPWMHASPELLVCVTSRERLGVEGEMLLEVGPLPVPRDDDALDVESVELLIRRARAVRPDFSPSPTDVPVLAELVRRLDGLPLAIELAAARMGVLGPKQLLDRLPRGIDLLGDPRDKRRGALRSTIDWSWNLLEPHERTALGQLAAFHGGFMLDAVEAVLDFSGHPGAPAAIDVLQSLRDKSLLCEAEAQELAGEIRFDMLQTIRAYADEKLVEQGAADAVLARHAAYYVEAGKRWAVEVDQADGAEALRRIAVEMPNLLAVHRRALAAPTPERVAQALEAILALEPVFYMRGPAVLCSTLLDAALAAVPEAPAAGPPPALLALALKARGRALRDLGRLEESAVDLERALALARGLGDRSLEGRILGHVAALRDIDGAHEEARALLEEAVRAARDAGDARSEGMLLAALAHALGRVGRAEDAMAAYDEALRIHRAVGNRYAAAFALASRAALYRAAGRHEAARIDLEQALAGYRAFGERRHEGNALADLASLQQELGDFEEARASYDRALACHRAYGSRWFEGLALGRLGDLEWHLGRHALARSLYAEALGIAREVGDHAGEARWLQGLERAAPRREPAPPPARSLAVCSSGRWFRLSGATTVSLARRHALRLLLQRFVERRLDVPGGALDQADLLEAGWPGEKIRPQAGSLRVYNALSTLRKLGLRDVLLSRDDGYLLDPRVPVERVAEDVAT